MRCDAGRGCSIDCPGHCVAKWDDLNLCETRCLGTDNVQQMLLGPRFSLSLHAGDGKQVDALFGHYLPRDLSDQLKKQEGPVDLELRDATTQDLLTGLYQAMGGLAAR